jgi:hypothetical protein
LWLSLEVFFRRSGDPEAQIACSVKHYNHGRCRESLHNLTHALAYFDEICFGPTSSMIIPRIF